MSEEEKNKQEQQEGGKPYTASQLIVDLMRRKTQLDVGEYDRIIITGIGSDEDKFVIELRKAGNHVETLHLTLDEDYNKTEPEISRRETDDNVDESQKLSPNPDGSSSMTSGDPTVRSDYEHRETGRGNPDVSIDEQNILSDEERGATPRRTANTRAGEKGVTHVDNQEGTPNK